VLIVVVELVEHHKRIGLWVVPRERLPCVDQVDGRPERP